MKACKIVHHPHVLRVESSSIVVSCVFNPCPGVGVPYGDDTAIPPSNEYPFNLVPRVPVIAAVCSDRAFPSPKQASRISLAYTLWWVIFSIESQTMVLRQTKGLPCPLCSTLTSLMVSFASC